MPLEFGRGLGPKVFEERGSESIPAVAFSPNGKWFATVDQHSREPWDIDGRATIIRVFETANWTLRTRYVAGPLATAICWKPDNRTAYVGHANGMISELELIPEK
jgi:WD40 repeat protein